MCMYYICTIFSGEKYASPFRFRKWCNSCIMQIMDICPVDVFFLQNKWDTVFSPKSLEFSWISKFLHIFWLKYETFSIYTCSRIVDPEYTRYFVVGDFRSFEFWTSIIHNFRENFLLKRVHRERTQSIYKFSFLND